MIFAASESRQLSHTVPGRTINILYQPPQSASVRAVSGNVPDFVLFTKINHDINLLEHASRSKKLHLVACYVGADNGSAQQLANYLQHSIVSYGGNHEIFTRALISAYLGKPKAHVCGSFSNLPSKRLPPKIFNPAWQEHQNKSLNTCKMVAILWLLTFRDKAVVSGSGCWD